MVKFVLFTIVIYIFIDFDIDFLNKNYYPRIKKKNYIGRVCNNDDYYYIIYYL